MAAGYDGSIRIDTSIDSKGFNTGVNGIMNSIKGIAAAVGIAFGVNAIVNFIKSCANAASAMEILRNRFRGVFGAEATYAYQQLEILGAKINMTADDLMGLAATLQNTFVALGFGGVQAADLSLQLTKLTEDLATFYGVSDTEMAQTLVMALQGMTRGLKALGISINEADIKQKAMTLGLYAGTGAVNEQARAQAILALITDKTAAAQGNAEKTAHTWAGELRGLVGAWNQFKVALGTTITIFAPMIAALSSILHFLTIIATYISMVVSLLTGTKIDIGSVGSDIGDAAGSAGDLSDNMGSAADNTAKAGKAAKGALAAFDELNVLQQAEPSGGGGGVTPPGGFTVPGIKIPAPFTDKELATMWAKAQKFVDDLKLLWAMIVYDFQHPWETLKRWWKELWDPIVGAAKQAWETTKLVISTAWEIIKQKASEIWENIKQTVSDAWENIKQTVSTAWEIIKQKISEVWGNIKQTVSDAWENIKKTVGEAWDIITKKVSDAWENIKTKWVEAGDWFKVNVTDKIKDAWNNALDWIKEKWDTIWGDTGIKLVVKNAINGIIGFINGMISAVVGGINSVIRALNTIHFSLPAWIPIVGGKSFGINLPEVSAPQIPLLATGAVIPPNAAFAAILGEQRAGKNIEAPEALIRQIVAEEIGKSQGNQQITINFAGSLGALIREMKPYIDKENVRIGNSLIRGVTG